MPILAATDAPDPWTHAVFAGVCLLVGLGIGLRLFRPRRVDTPDRVPPRASALPLVAVMGVGLFIWYGVPLTYFSYKQAQSAAREGPQATIDPSKLSASELAFLATVPPAAGLVGLLAGDVAVRRGFGIDLGFRPWNAPRGVAYGLLGSLSVVPLLYGFMMMVDWVYRAVGYEHPREHDLLRALGESGEPVTNATLIVGATVMAPVFEELMFRGHLQTILRRALARAAWAGRPAAAPAPDARGEPAGHVPGSPPGVVGVIPYGAPDSESPPLVPSGWATWGAILVTSALFTGVHAPWTWPPIFLLSLLLGYAYERTGNLWVPVTIHAAFNTTSTVFYLLMGGAN